MPYLKKMLTNSIKILFGDVRSSIVSIIVLSALGGGSIFLFVKNLWRETLVAIQSPTPLWVTIVLVLVLLAYIYLKNLKSIPLSTPDPKYRKKFGVFWDENDDMRCLNCGKHLKAGTKEHYVFWCCDNKCKAKYALKDDNGYKLTESDARKQLNE